MTNMENNQIKAIVYGIGTAGKVAVRYMTEKGVKIVGAIDLDPAIVGKDLGVVAGLGKRLNVTISDDADSVLSMNGADIAVVSIFSQIDRMFPMLKKCIENNLNVITLAEEALYPWGIAPALASELDALAKKHGVTLLGTGSQDSSRLNMISVLTGTCKSIESISIRQTGDIGESGPASAANYHIGDTKEHFYRSIKEKGIPLSSLRICVEGIIADLDLTIKTMEERAEATIADTEVVAKGIPGGIVKKGWVTGMSKVCHITTEQGIDFHAEQISKAFSPEEKKEGAVIECLIKGVPELHSKLYVKEVELKSPAVSSLVNRIPDVINAEPGYVTAEKLSKNKLKFKAFPLHCYLNGREKERAS